MPAEPGRADRPRPPVLILTGRAIMADWAAWRRQPEIYVSPGLYGVFGLFLHRLRSEAELVEAAAARLRAIPRSPRPRTA